jgi:hypothetical protein
MVIEGLRTIDLLVVFVMSSGIAKALFGSSPGSPANSAAQPWALLPGSLQAVPTCFPGSDPDAAYAGAAVTRATAGRGQATPFARLRRPTPRACGGSVLSGVMSCPSSLRGEAGDLHAGRRVPHDSARVRSPGGERPRSRYRPGACRAGTSRSARTEPIPTVGRRVWPTRLSAELPTRRRPRATASSPASGGGSRRRHPSEGRAAAPPGRPQPPRSSLVARHTTQRGGRSWRCSARVASFATGGETVEAPLHHVMFGDA